MVAASATVVEAMEAATIAIGIVLAPLLAVVGGPVITKIVGAIIMRNAGEGTMIRASVMTGGGTTGTEGTGNSLS